MAGLEGVTSTDLHGDELTVASADGAATVSPVAVALAGTGVRVKDLTLRTPTLDDVFLEMTGNRIGGSDADHEEDAR